MVTILLIMTLCRTDGTCEDYAVDKLNSLQECEQQIDNLDMRCEVYYVL